MAAPMCVSNVFANELTIKSDGSSAGYVTLGWTGNEGGTFTLQTQKSGSWVTLYEGVDTATTLTGLSDGSYLFRVRENDGDWSAPFTVTIEHHPLWKALAFFISGLLLFVILCALLIVSPKSERSARSSL